MKTSQTHIPSLLNSLIFTLGAFFYFSASLVMGSAALFAILSEPGIQTQQTIFFLVFGVEGIILAIAAFVSVRKFLNHASADAETTLSLPVWQIGAGVILAGIAIATGSFISGQRPINWLFLPILTAPAVIAPLWIILGLGIRKIPLGERWRVWSVLGLGMTLGPFILVILEVIAAIVVFLGIILYVASQPELAGELQSLAEQMQFLDPNSESAVRLLLPYLTRPITVVTALTYFAVVVPAVEEIFKPIGVWLFASRIESAAQGFAFGALSGAGYALVETFGVSGQAGAWGDLLFTRIGTGLLHITTSGLMGAAIFAARRERRYLRFFGIYLLATALHGIWNASALAYSFSDLINTVEGATRFAPIHSASLISLILLTLAFLFVLFTSNLRFRTDTSKDMEEESSMKNAEENPNA